MPPPYKKEKLILKIYIRLLLYIKEKYNEIKNPDALLQHLTNMALDKTFYDLFTTAAQIELETAKKRELETAKKRVLETVTKIETQEDVKSRMRKHMEELIDTMKSMKEEVYVAGDNSQDYLDKLKFPENLNDLTTLLQLLGEREEHMRTIHKDADQTSDIDNTIRIILLLLRRVEIKILNARNEEDKIKQAEQAEQAVKAEIKAGRRAKVQEGRRAEKDHVDVDDGDDDDD
jgi:hypothetical protein